MASRRRIYRVVPDRRHGWAIKEAQHVVALWDRKADAIRDARERARRGQPSQLFIHNRDGRIAFEHTYGRDPERFKG